MEELGYHALFTGTMTHFYGIGYLTRFDKYVGGPLMYLSLGPSPFIYTMPIVLPIMLLQKNRNEGYVEIVKETAATELRQNSGVTISVRTHDPEPDVVDGLRGVVVQAKARAGAAGPVEP